MKPITPLRLEAAQLIVELDKVIGTVRLLLLDAPVNSKHYRHWSRRIDELLDQRLHLQRLSNPENHR